MSYSGPDTRPTPACTHEHMARHVARSIACGAAVQFQPPCLVHQRNGKTRHVAMSGDLLRAGVRAYLEEWSE